MVEDRHRETQHPHDLCIVGVIVVTEQPGEFYLFVFAQQRRPLTGMLFLADPFDHVIQFVVCIEDAVTEHFGDIPVRLDVLGQMVEIVPGIPENSFSDIQTAETHRRKIPIRYHERLGIADFPRVDQPPFFPKGQIAEAGILPLLDGRHEIVSVGTIGIRKRRLAGIHDEIVPVRVTDLVAQRFERRDRNGFFARD